MSHYFAAATVTQQRQQRHTAAGPLGASRSVLSVTGHRHPDVTSVFLATLPELHDATCARPPCSRPAPLQPLDVLMHADSAPSSLSSSCCTEPTSAVEVSPVSTSSGIREFRPKHTRHPSLPPRHESERQGPEEQRGSLFSSDGRRNDRSPPRRALPSPDLEGGRSVSRTVSFADMRTSLPTPKSKNMAKAATSPFGRRLPPLPSSKCNSAPHSLPPAVVSRSTASNANSSVATDITSSSHPSAGAGHVQAAGVGAGGGEPPRQPSLARARQYMSFFSDDGNDNAAVQEFAQRHPSLPAFPTCLVEFRSPEEFVLGLANPRAPMQSPQFVTSTTMDRSVEASLPSLPSLPRAVEPAKDPTPREEDTAVRAAFIRKVIKRAPKGARAQKA